MSQLGAGALLSLSASAVRRQGWLLVPRTLARALGRLLAAVPGLVLVIEAIRAGRHAGASGLGESLLAGLPEVFAHPGTWVVAGVGAVLVAFGGWLLSTIVRAGALHLLATQLGHSERVGDDKFAEGAVESSASAFLSGALVGLFELTAFCSSIGMVIAGMTYFTHAPGALAALMMTIATCAVVSVPVITIGLEVGFVRAVILCEPAFTALASGMALARRQADALLPVWFVIAIVQAGTVIAFGFGDAILGAAGKGDLAILMLGPRTLLGVAGLVAISAVELILLGVYAALVQQDTGRLPAAAEPVLPAIPIVDAVT